MPLLILAGILEIRSMWVDTDGGMEAKDGSLSSAAIAFEVTNNIETVASLHKERHFIDKFQTVNKEKAREGVRSCYRVCWACR